MSDETTRTPEAAPAPACADPLDFDAPDAPEIDWDQAFGSQDGVFETNVDIVFCIDVTGSMGPVLSKSKMLARDLIGQINRGLAEKNRKVSELRVKVIAFGDYYCDERPLEESGFFSLPEQEGAYHDYLNSLVAHGGGDAPESSLEALYKAFTSDWCTTGARRRHIIVLFSDTSPHDLDDPRRDRTVGYPQDMPRSLVELEDVWNDGQGRLGSTERRMAIFAPDDESCEVWKKMGSSWDLVHHHPCVAGAGLSELDMNFVVNWIANSI